jgi:hypothetical protein
LDVLQILWFLASPFVAHDIGGSRCKNNHRLIDVSYVSAADTNQVLWINTNPIAGSLLHPN